MSLKKVVGICSGIVAAVAFVAMFAFATMSNMPEVSVKPDPVLMKWALGSVAVFFVAFATCLIAFTPKGNPRYPYNRD